MVYTWRRGYATQSAVSLSRPFAFARTGAPRTPFSPLWWGWIRLEPTAVNICANFFPSKIAHIFAKKFAEIVLTQNFVEIIAHKFTLFFAMQIFAKYFGKIYVGNRHFFIALQIFVQLFSLEFAPFLLNGK